MFQKMLSRNPHIPLFTLLLLSSVLHGVHCKVVQYDVINGVPNTPAGKFFTDKIGAGYAWATAIEVAHFIWQQFKQNTHATRNVHPVVYINITDTVRNGIMAQTSPNTIFVNAHDVYEFFSPANINPRSEFTGLMYHEMTHILQWSGRYTAPGGLTEGIADYIRIKSGYYHPETYTKPGEGPKWDAGYGVTARFLEYCDTLRKDFTPDLNNMMREVYKDEYFKDLLGKPVDQLWREYKAKYGNRP